MQITTTDNDLSVQVSIAKQYPRSNATFVKHSIDIVTSSELIANSCVFALPRGKDVIQGASIGLAETLLQNYGNCKAASRIIHEGDKTVTAQSVFIDLERNNVIQNESHRSITNKYGKRYNQDMIMMTSNAACAIALRNSILTGIGRSLWMPVYEAARRTIAGDARTLSSRRDDALSFLMKMGVKESAILKVLNRVNAGDISTDDLVILRGLATAIKAGDTTIESAFGEDNGQNTTTQNHALPQAPIKQAQSTASESVESNGLSEAEFEKKLTGYASVISSGTQSHDQLLGVIGKRYELTVEQIAAIKSLK